MDLRPEWFSPSNPRRQNLFPCAQPPVQRDSRAPLLTDHLALKRYILRKVRDRFPSQELWSDYRQAIEDWIDVELEPSWNCCLPVDIDESTLFRQEAEAILEFLTDVFGQTEEAREEAGSRQVYHLRTRRA